MVFSSSQKKGGYVTEKQSLVQDCKNTINVPYSVVLCGFYQITRTYLLFAHR
ncbi:hypothetical protein N483_16870 [Pseudoalteromonas luteoviolacea NCIMB 1944]|nr:hypothetical protein N483_16870 [Pseudoalteromonas luteoviolacea NCIMB 1944]